MRITLQTLVLAFVSLWMLTSCTDEGEVLAIDDNMMEKLFTSDVPIFYTPVGRTNFVRSEDGNDWKKTDMVADGEQPPSSFFIHKGKVIRQMFLSPYIPSFEFEMESAWKKYLKETGKKIDILIGKPLTIQESNVILDDGSVIISLSPYEMKTVDKGVFMSKDVFTLCESFLDPEAEEIYFESWKEARRYVLGMLYDYFGEDLPTIRRYPDGMSKYDALINKYQL